MSHKNYKNYKNYKTSEMVEAGILAAVGVLFAILGTYLPVLGALFNFLWPMPIAICGVRNGFRWSLMALIVAGAVIGSLLGPFQGLSIIVMFGLPGLAIGECMRRGYKPMLLMGISSVVGMVALALSVVTAMMAVGADPISMVFSGLQESLADSMTYYEAAGMSEAEIAEAMKANEEMLEGIKIVLPAAFMLCSPIIVYGNYIATRKVLQRMGMRFHEIPAFTTWRVPEWMIWPLALSIFGASITGAQVGTTMYQVLVNLQMLVSAVFFVQGLSVLFWWLKKNECSKSWGYLAFAATFVIPMASFAFVIVGACEVVLDVRGLKEEY